MVKGRSSGSPVQMVVMLRSIAITVLILLSFSPSYPQKLTEPKLLGSWTGGEDPSEFLIHKVIETSADLLKGNPNGEIIVRICSADDFPKAFVKTALDPLSVNFYNRYRPTFPEGRIFVSRYKPCVRTTGFVHNEYWFVPNGRVLEYDEVRPLNEIQYRKFIYSFESEKSRIENEKRFYENIMDFIDELRKNQNAKGLIFYSSTNKRMRRNIQKVMAQLTKEKIDIGRIETVEVRYQRFGDVYPNLATFGIKPV